MRPPGGGRVPEEDAMTKNDIFQEGESGVPSVPQSLAGPDKGEGSGGAAPWQPPRG